MAYCSENCQLLDWMLHALKCGKADKGKKVKKTKEKKKKSKIVNTEDEVEDTAGKQ